MENRSNSAVGEMVHYEQRDETDEGLGVWRSPTPVRQVITPPLYSYDTDAYSVIYLSWWMFVSQSMAKFLYQCCTGYLNHCMTKPAKWHVHPVKTQISLGIRPVWSESSLFAWRNIGSFATCWAPSEGSDQTGWMLIWVFTGCTSFCWFCLAAAQLLIIMCFYFQHFRLLQLFICTDNCVQNKSFVIVFFIYCLHMAAHDDT